MKITRRSMFTGIEHTLDINCTEAQLASWHSGVHIQDAMPNVSAPEREFILTGTTPEEWDEMFGSEE